MDMQVVKERLGNLLQILTSKKALMCSVGILLVVLLASPTKIIVCGALAVAYILAQGYVDCQKEANKKCDCSKGDGSDLLQG